MPTPKADDNFDPDDPKHTDDERAPREDEPDEEGDAQRVANPGPAREDEVLDELGDADILDEQELENRGEGPDA